ncbi:hypothetical protein [Legionella massiliensis]|uniref:hypothetical protein n=1 Tax=Legionella massiliensis TaxID=1034943 RepID=UPI0005C3A811|nr:hypothetical protein [Legionella massiliensis]
MVSAKVINSRPFGAIAEREALHEKIADNVMKNIDVTITFSILKNIIIEDLRGPYYCHFSLIRSQKYNENDLDNDELI